MSTILVTGGAGYIGSHVVKTLLGAGDQTVIIDDLSKGHREAVADAKLVVGDFGEEKLLSALFAAHEFEAVMHFAASSYVGESVLEPGLYYENNVVNSLVLLKVMRQHGVKKLIFSSTAAVYGEPSTMPIRESTPLQPVNPYGYTKLVIENTLADFSRAYGLCYASLRYFNAAGADPGSRMGESHDPETHLIPRVLAAALGRLPHVEIFGLDYPTEDGTCIRDYIHVNDLAAAHVAALRALENGEKSLVVNLGNNRGYSVKEIIQVAEEVTQRSIPVVPGARRPGDPPVLVCDNLKARTQLGWEPQISSLREIIETAWQWELKRCY